jgi:hypothetical protein
MSKFDGAIGWLDLEIDKAEEKLGELRRARGVLEQYAPADSALLKPKSSPRQQKQEALVRTKPKRVVALTPPRHAKTESARRQLIAAAAAKVAPKKALAAAKVVRPCGCAGRWGRHRGDCKLRVKPEAADSEPAPAAAPAPVVAAREATVLRLSHKTGRPVKSRALGERMFRCLHPVLEEHGTLKKTRQCGETVWDADRQKHLHREHDLLTEAWGGYFEQLKDPEEESDAIAAA